MLRSSYQQLGGPENNDAQTPIHPAAKQYFWNVAEGVASRMGVTEVTEELVAGGGLEAAIKPALPRTSLFELGTEALKAISDSVESMDQLAEISSHTLPVNLMMSKAHAELYDTAEDPRGLAAISLGQEHI